MTEQQLATRNNGADVLESVVIGGDLSKLSPAERVNYYKAVCTSLALNPLTKPFEYIQLNGKLTLYARKDATDQLRNSHKVSITKLERELVNDVYVVTAYATLPDGRQDSSIGAVSITNLKGDAIANAMMKSETKSKRRVTLSICGLGMLDETEIETIPSAVVIPVTNIENDGSPMTIEQAQTVTNSKGTSLLIDISTPQLSDMAAKLGNLAKRTPAQETELLAIQVITHMRAAGKVAAEQKAG